MELSLPVRFLLVFLGTWISGERLRVPARDGQTLYEVAVTNDVLVGDLYTCHVILTPESYAAHDPPYFEETRALESVTDLAPTSRLASFLKMTSKVQETYVALCDVRDWDTP